VREILQPGDALLLGTDLEKDVTTQLLAYDDPAGVTAAFNLNVLARINRDWERILICPPSGMRRAGIMSSGGSKCICARCSGNA